MFLNKSQSSNNNKDSAILDGFDLDIEEGKASKGKTKKQAPVKKGGAKSKA
jgi:hypothetical protein